MVDARRQPLSPAACRRVLGVGPEDGPHQVRRAYRRLMLRHHPDLHPRRTRADERFHEIQQAYRALKQHMESHGGAPFPDEPDDPPAPRALDRVADAWRIGGFPALLLPAVVLAIAAGKRLAAGSSAVYFALFPAAILAAAALWGLVHFGLSVLRRPHAPPGGEPS